VSALAGLIPSDFIDRLLERVDIVDVIGARVELKQVGKEHQACCPFHNEKTPSFTVSPTKQFYHCFGGGAHGTAIGFLMEYERLPFPEAVEELARHVGIEVPREGVEVRHGPDPRPLYALMQQAADLYWQQWRDHSESDRARAYLKGRGLSGEIAKRFQIGFAPPGWDFLLQRLGGDPEREQRLVDAGLVVEREDGRHYDRFRDRIMFPIRDRRGRVIAFGGRVLGDGEPKYLNSPETAIFHKGRGLYGLYEAQQNQRELPRLLVVEGYMDVVALAQLGIPCAVATLGTATTAEHLRLLLRSAAELVFCFDGDRAGRAAAWKALKTALPLAGGGQTIRFLLLPQGEDPDSLVRVEGGPAFTARIANATLLSDFMFEQLAEGLDLDTTEGRSRLDAAARPLIQGIPSGTFRTLVEQRLADAIGVPASVLDIPDYVPAPAPSAMRSAAAGAGRSQAIPPRRMTRPRPGMPDISLSPARRAIALLLHEPQLAVHLAEAPSSWREHESTEVELLAEVLEVINAYPAITPAALWERWRGSEWESVVMKLSDSSLTGHIPFEGRGAELVGALERIADDAARERRWRLLRSGRGSELVDQPMTPPGGDGSAPR
jgi:DNA primase